MTLFERLNEMQAPIKVRGRQVPREELMAVYPFVCEMFTDMIKAQNLGYSMHSVAQVVIERMAAEGKKTIFIKEGDVVDIFRHVKRDRELRGLDTE